jgi:hypothetical protein
MRGACAHISTQPLAQIPGYCSVNHCTSTRRLCSPSRPVGASQSQLSSSMWSFLMPGCRTRSAAFTARARWRENTIAVSGMLRSKLAAALALKFSSHAVIDMTAQHHDGAGTDLQEFLDGVQVLLIGLPLAIQRCRAGLEEQANVLAQQGIALQRHVATGANRRDGDAFPLNNPPQCSALRCCRSAKPAGLPGGASTRHRPTTTTERCPERNRRGLAYS